MDTGIKDVFRKINERQYEAPQWVWDALDELERKGWNVFDEPKAIDGESFGASGDAWNLQSGDRDLTIFAIDQRSAKSFLRKRDRSGPVSIAMLPDGTFQTRVRLRVGRGDFEETFIRRDISELPEWEGSARDTDRKFKEMAQ